MNAVLDPVLAVAHERRLTILILGEGAPFAFMRCVRAAFGQRGCPWPFEVVAVDCDPAGAAMPFLRAAAHEAPCRFIFVPGGADPLAAGLTQATGGYVAFLTPDLDIKSHWLAGLAQELRGTDLVLGPIRARAPQSLKAGRAGLERALSRLRPPAPGEAAPLTNMLLAKRLVGEISGRQRFVPPRWARRRFARQAEAVQILPAEAAAPDWLMRRAFEEGAAAPARAPGLALAQAMACGLLAGLAWFTPWRYGWLIAAGRAWGRAATALKTGRKV